MKITILGAGPAGLYCAILLKKANPLHEITILERNAPDATYGWGVVFSDRTLAAFQEADYKSYKAITDRFVLWDAIDVYYRDELLRCGGHVFAGLARKQLLALLQRRCAELGVSMRFNTEVADVAALDGGYDLLIAADGVNSLVRKTFADIFKPSLVPGKARYIWLGMEKVLDAFTFIFRENEHGLFQVHSYPFDGTTSTFIVECDETTWRRAGLDAASEDESITYCERLFAPELAGRRLLPNNSKWINFVTVKNATWRHGNIVLLGDAAHTAHFSIGSGTKLAMEDAVALANALDTHPDLDTALGEYEAERRPVVELFQAAAAESQSYFENVKRYTRLTPVEFTFNLLTRSRRITYDDLRLRDPRFGNIVDREFERRYWAGQGRSIFTLIAPPPMFAPLTLRGLRVANRAVFTPATTGQAVGGVPCTGDALELARLAQDGAGMVLTEPVAVAAEGRITSDSACLHEEEHLRAWTRIIQAIHTQSPAKVAMPLNHAGRRGATRPRGAGLDRPLRDGAWPLVSASALPYTARSQTPRALDRAGMDGVRDAFAHSAHLADAAGVDLLILHMGHGYLLSSFLSPLTNRRDDEYGGALEQRMRFPLEVFDSVRAAWPGEKPLAVALNVADSVGGGFGPDDAATFARTLKEHGCDLLMALAGYVVPQTEMPYRRGFLTPLSERIRNDSGLPTLVGGYLTTADEVNTLLAGGRADLCLMLPPQDTRTRSRSAPPMVTEAREARAAADVREEGMPDAGAPAREVRRAEKKE